jgi:hypothetical protein
VSRGTSEQSKLFYSSVAPQQIELSRKLQRLHSKRHSSIGICMTAIVSEGATPCRQFGGAVVVGHSKLPPLMQACPIITYSASSAGREGKQSTGNASSPIAT